MLLDSTIDSGSSPVEDVLVVDSGRKDEEVNAALLKKCSKVEGYVEKAIKNELGSGGLTSKCYDLFSKTTVLKCIVVPPS